VEPVVPDAYELVDERLLAGPAAVLGDQLAEGRLGLAPELGLVAEDPDAGLVGDGLKWYGHPRRT
jgi:hypothetical protein